MRALLNFTISLLHCGKVRRDTNFYKTQLVSPKHFVDCIVLKYLWSVKYRSMSPFVNIISKRTKENVTQMRAVHVVRKHNSSCKAHTKISKVHFVVIQVFFVNTPVTTVAPRAFSLFRNANIRRPIATDFNRLAFRLGFFLRLPLVPLSLLIDFRVGRLTFFARQYIKSWWWQSFD